MLCLCLHDTVSGPKWLIEYIQRGEALVCLHGSRWSSEEYVDIRFCLCLGHLVDLFVTVACFGWCRCCLAEERIVDLSSERTSLVCLSCVSDQFGEWRRDWLASEDVAECVAGFVVDWCAHRKK